MILLRHPDAHVVVEELAHGRRSVRVSPFNRDLFMQRDHWETSYPVDLLQKMLRTLGPTWLCDEIMREEDPAYVRKNLESDLFAYFTRCELEGKRILDFGCGCGASTVLLARIFPEANIAGVELNPDLLSIAKSRIEFYGYPNVKFFRSPSGSELPGDIGRFDFVIMSAVYEHLLPQERKTILPRIWKLIMDGGYLFIDQTPHRLFPIELHTTMLPFVNYLPKPLALEFARRFSRRVGRDESWETLLRKGIRGGTVREILRFLSEGEGHSILLEPHHLGLRDRIDLWSFTTKRESLPAAKPLIKALMKVLKFVTGISLVPCLSLAIQKKRTLGETGISQHTDHH